MDQKFFHSVRLDKEKCKGCTNCLKRCPTEAIRFRYGFGLTGKSTNGNPKAKDNQQNTTEES